MRRLFVTLLLLAASACIVDSRPPPEDPSEHPVPIPSLIISYAIDPMFTPMEANLIEKAEQKWVEGSGGRVAWEVGDWNEADIRFMWIPRLEDLPGFGGKNIRYVGEWSAENRAIYLVETQLVDADMFEAISVHEISHSLGIKHFDGGTDDVESCMTPAVNPLCLISHMGKIPPRDRIAYCKENGCYL